MHAGMDHACGDRNRKRQAGLGFDDEQRSSLRYDGWPCAKLVLISVRSPQICLKSEYLTYSTLCANRSDAEYRSESSSRYAAELVLPQARYVVDIFGVIVSIRSWYFCAASVLARAEIHAPP